MAEETGQEKTEEPTPKRLNDARDKGQVARSRELTTALLMMTGAAMFLLTSERIGSGLANMMRQNLSIDRDLAFNPQLALPVFFNSLLDIALLLAPFIFALVLVAAFAPMALGGFVLSGQSLAPKLDKLDPIKGLGRIFSARGLVELLKALAKFALIGGVAVGLLWYFRPELIGLGNETLDSGVAHMGYVLRWSFLFLTSGLLLIAAVDVPFQIWDHQKKLRMTRQEIKDENKETDGRPEVKGRIRQLQRELAQGRMMEKVPTADVVVTNPTHYAVALRYDPTSMGAPVVVAKGSDLLAAQIRSLALGADVPLFSAPPLARALFASVEVDQEVPQGLYLAVAQVIAYVFALRKVRRGGGVTPDKPIDLPIPDEYAVPARDGAI